MSRLEGQVVLVTGGASGIGRAVVERFLEEGAHVGVIDLVPDSLDHALQGDTLLAMRGDVTSYADCAAAVTATVERFGRLDTLVANAGVTDAFRAMADLEAELLEQVFDEVLAVNVKGYLLACKAALSALVASRGSIVFTLSNSSFYPNGGGPAYVAAKHAALGLLRQLAWELAPIVRVNGVAPGGTLVEMGLAPALARSGNDAAGTSEDLDALISGVSPLARAAHPEDHADAYVLLACRDSNRSMTGTVIESDGGLGIRGVISTRGGAGLTDSGGTDA